MPLVLVAHNNNNSSNDNEINYMQVLPLVLVAHEDGQIRGANCSSGRVVTQW